MSQMVHEIKLALDLHSVGSLPSEEQNAQNSQVGERRSGLYVSGRLDAEHIGVWNHSSLGNVKGPASFST